MEIWRDIEGYEGLYQVSSDGRVKSLEKVNNNHLVKEKILKSGNNGMGYLFVVLSKEGKIKNYTIHRLVAQAFLPNPDNLPQVNHKDEDKSNNRVENLEWCTQQYNNTYGTRLKKSAKANSIPILQFNLDSQFIKKWDSTMQIERELGFYHSNISNCCRGKYKTAYGFVWMYQKIGVFEIDVNKLKRVA